jgi:monoamine oxidase
LARAYKEHTLDGLGRGSGDPPIAFEDTTARLEGEARTPGWPTGPISRRDLLRAGGVLGAGVALAACTTSSARPTPHDARVVVVGAGLAGTAAAYQLHRVGVRVQLFEARDRIGGRCWTARGFADGQIAEHGGEFIDSRHVHIRRLSHQLGLELDDLFPGYAGSFSPIWVDGAYLHHDSIHPQMQRIGAAVTAEGRRIGVVGTHGKASTKAISYGTATAAAVEVDRLSMAAWLDRHVPGVLGSPVGRWLDEVMCGWYGLNLDALSALNWIDYFLIPYPGADERWHVRGGNDQVPRQAAAALPQGSIHTDTPLRAIRRRATGAYELTFDGIPAPVVADLLILTLPFTTLRQVDLRRADFGAHKMAAIRDLAMGFDAKVLVQYDRRPHTMHDWSGGMDSADPDFDTWESSAAQGGRAGLVTVYAGGRTGAGWDAPHPHGPAPSALRDGVLGRIDRAVPGSRRHFNGRAWADLWPRDPWTAGAYAAFAPGQYTRFWNGAAQADGNAHFAGEATSTFSQGYLNGGVESGDRTAIEVMRKLRIPVPASLGNMPYSPA